MIRVEYRSVGTPKYESEGESGECSISILRAGPKDFNGTIDATVVDPDSCKTDEPTTLPQSECGTDAQAQPNPSATPARHKLSCSKTLHIHASMTLHNMLPM